MWVGVSCYSSLVGSRSEVPVECCFIKPEWLVECEIYAQKTSSLGGKGGRAHQCLAPWGICPCVYVCAVAWRLVPCSSVFGFTCSLALWNLDVRFSQ